MDILEQIDKGLQLLQEEIHPQFQTHQLRILLMLARRHPDAVAYADIEKELNLSNAAVSRNAKLMGINRQKDGAGKWIDTGMHLVEVRIDEYETRRNLIGLTSRGYNLISTLKKIVGD